MSTIPAESRATPAKVLAFPTATEQDPRWARVVARDRAADGAFFYSVATTGVYCRPSCASRRANPKNVRFHATAAACEAAGFRPCKRCKPDQLSQEARNAEKIARHSEGLRRAEPRRQSAQGTDAKPHRDGSDLRRRLQFQRPVL
jgi:AraC family transcriptional regulator of adaptative response/methylated-DNA-[protein]-cysteine methyltransferase